MNSYDVEEDIVAEPDEITWVSSLFNGFALLQANAWYVAAVAAFMYYIWREKLSLKYYKWKEGKELRESSAQIRKDPELLILQEEARMSAIQRLQEEYNQQALKVKEIEKDKEKKKREELISKMKLQNGRKLNDDYFPLAGSSLHYRASRRSRCSGGSCNNR